MLVLKRGDQGQLVRDLQVALNRSMQPALPPTGFFGSQTETFVRQFQTARGLTSDGEAGPATLTQLGCMPVRGIDVSHHNGQIDWAKVAADGVKFAWVKCTQNEGNADERFRENVMGAQANGIKVGPYHFAIADGRDVEHEAAWFLAHVAGLQFDLPCALDLESNPGALSPADLVGWACQWVHTVGAQQAKMPMLYTGEAFIGDRLAGGAPLVAMSVPLWVARYTGAPDPGAIGQWGRWTCWQWSQSGTVAGIDGPVDLNWMAGGDARLAQLCGGV